MVIIMANKANSLAHTKWMCKYHIIFTPKYRRKVIYNQYRKDLGEILRELCKYKHVEIIEGHLMRDHVHMLVMIPPSLSVSAFMGYLKGKSALMMFDRHANLKYKLGKRHFWSEGYYVSTVGLNDVTVASQKQSNRNINKKKQRKRNSKKMKPFEGWRESKAIFEVQMLYMTVHLVLFHCLSLANIIGKIS